MKTYTRVIFFAAMLSMTSACAREPVPAKAPEQPARTVVLRCPDNFDKAGSMVADGSRWAWNESSQVWEWFKSDDTQATIKGAVEVVKDKSKKTYDSVMQDNK